MTHAVGIFIGGPVGGQHIAVEVLPYGEPPMTQEFRQFQGNPLVGAPGETVKYTTIQYLRYRIPNEDGSWNYLYLTEEGQS